MRHNLLKLFIVAPAVIFMILAAAPYSLDLNAGAAGQDLPEGPGADIARNQCTTCHEADLIRSQRLSRQGWTREVDKMIRWGATVPDADKEKLIDYLAANFPARHGAATSQAGSSPGSMTDRGKAVFETRCTTCHEADLTEQQRMSRQGWTREVEKMIRWGATVPEADKAPLVDYLSANFGLRPLKK